MEATRTRHATIDDLLERLLEKGIILNLDLVIGVAGIPLIGVNLRAAIAAIETLIEYGIMEAWDEDIRKYAATEIQRKKIALAPGESVTLEMFGSYWYSNGIYRAWQSGRLFLTDRRLIVYRPEPAEVLFQTPLDAIQDFTVTQETHFTGTERDIFRFSLNNGNVAAIYAEDTEILENALETRLTGLGNTPKGDLAPFQRERAIGGLIPEKIIADGVLWYQTPGAGIHGPTWRPGWLYLTVDRLIWWSEFDRQIGLEIPLGKIQGIHMEDRDLSGVLNTRQVLAVAFKHQSEREEAYFSGDELPQWQRAIKAQVLDYGGGGFDVGY
ncbi:MAG: gas vesicle protein [Anaerolineales bacterium]|nr:gas vesicle protein [Anaerolineales bacterium]